MEREKNRIYPVVDPEIASIRIEELQKEILELAAHRYRKKEGLILIFQGPDAAGKGGAIRRITNALDTSMFRIVPSQAPSPQEKARHYLWRYWRHILPNAGRLLILDRSWYGRVLVERVEGFAGQDEWMRAYREISDMERHYCEEGLPVLKFWIQITKEEQLRRFHARERSPLKQWKLTAEDWRNRDKWDLYQEAAREMFEKTSTAQAPWHVVYGNDKKYTRIRILELLKLTLTGEPESGKMVLPPEEGLPLMDFS